MSGTTLCLTSRIRHHGVTTKGWNGCFGSDSVDHASPRIR